MKRFVFAFILGMANITCQAQEHLRFMDIPLDGPIDKFCNLLIKEKGLVADAMTDAEQYPNTETRKLTGEFYGIKGITFYIRKHNRLDNVSSVIVKDTLFTLSKVDRERLISLFDEQYGTHEQDSIISLWYSWNTTGGNVELGIHKDGFQVNFTDNTEKEAWGKDMEEYQQERERQTVKEICGIPFGSTYEQAEEILTNKYGRSSFLSDREKIHYTNKSYAGIIFDSIIFLFQSDGYKSYMNGCVFILEATSLSQAKEKREMLYNELRWKYDMVERVDDNGNKCYLGGHSPISFGYGFAIDIIKYENRPKIPYAARLSYGRYNYVKEEF